MNNQQISQYLTIITSMINQLSLDLGDHDSNHSMTKVLSHP